MGMDLEKQRLSIEAAKLYYQSDYSQQDIAVRLGVSRPTVSRLLQYAKDRGYVRIEIMDPLEDIDIIAGELKAKYNLDTALVCFAPLKSDEEIQRHISKELRTICKTPYRMQILLESPGEQRCTRWPNNFGPNRLKVLKSFS